MRALHKVIANVIERLLFDATKSDEQRKDHDHHAGGHLEFRDLPMIKEEAKYRWEAEADPLNVPE